MMAAVSTGSTNAYLGVHWPPNREEITYLSTTYGPKLAGAVFTFIVGLVIARWIGKLTMRGLSKRDMEPPVRMLLVRLVKLLILF